jgi:hypothetical protein
MLEMLSWEMSLEVEHREAVYIFRSYYSLKLEFNIDSRALIVRLRKTVYKSNSVLGCNV